MRLNINLPLLRFALIISILISSSLCVDSTESQLMKKVINNIVKNIPNIKQEINNSKSISVVVNKIVESGFTTFKQQADMEYYKGVSDDNLTGFLTFVKSLLQLPDMYEKYFVENLSMILYSDFNEIVIFRVLFSVTEGGECKYICVMGQRTNEGLTDWLIGDVKANFQLSPDVFVVEKSVSTGWGLIKSTNSYAYVTPKSLTNDQLSILFKFFEVCVFERFAELLQIDKNTSQAFLQLDYLQ
jgi:hypothetical protein